MSTKHGKKQSHRWWLSNLSATPLNIICLAAIFLFPGVAFGNWLDSAANAFQTYDQISNKYFYASMGLLMVTLPALAKIRQGGQMRPVMARSVAMLLHTINAICLLFLIIHFAPETNTVFDVITGLFERIFG